MNKKFLFFITIFGMFSVNCFADDCLSYKMTPKIEIINPIWRKEVVQPLKPMSLLHGNVLATLVEEYEISVDITPIEDGFCVSLKSVKAVIGYSDFIVQVDLRHIPDSCGYNAILAHEDEHIRAYLSVIEDSNKDIKKTVYAAANSEMPIFVKNQEEVGIALDSFNNSLRSNPELILMNQKLRAEQEIRNKRVDQNDSNDTLKKCFE